MSTIKRDGRGRFLPGQSAHPESVWQPGTTGNPHGAIPKLRREFETAFYASLCEPEIAQQAVVALRKAIKEGAAWALQLYFGRILPVEAINLKVSRAEAEDIDAIDLTKLSTDELDQLALLIERTRQPRPALGSGEGKANPPDVR